MAQHALIQLIITFAHVLRDILEHSASLIIACPTLAAVLVLANTQDLHMHVHAMLAIPELRVQRRLMSVQAILVSMGAPVVTLLPHLLVHAPMDTLVPAVK